MSARLAPSSRPLPLLFVAFLFLFVFPRPSPPWVINVIIIRLGFRVVRTPQEEEEEEEEEVFRGGGGGGVYYQAVTGEARTTPFRVTTAQTSLRRRERTPAAKSCPAVSSPLPLNPLEIYCHALSRRPPCRRAEESLYEERSFTASSTGRGGSSARAVVVTALVTGRRTGRRPSLPRERESCLFVRTCESPTIRHQAQQ